MPIASPVAGRDVAEAEANHENHDRQLDHNDRGIEAGTLFNSDDKNRGDDQCNQEGWQVETDFHAEDSRCVDQIVGALHQLGRMCSRDCGDLVEESLSAGNERGIGGDCHLSRNGFLGYTQRRPVIVSQPERHFDIENIQQFNKVIRPTGRNRAGAHGVFECEIPTYDPGKNFTERGVSIGVSATRQRNHSGKFRVA